MAHDQHLFMVGKQPIQFSAHLAFPPFHGGSAELCRTLAVAFQQKVHHRPVFGDQGEQIVKMMGRTHNAVDHQHRNLCARHDSSVFLVIHTMHLLLL